MWFRWPSGQLGDASGTTICPGIQRQDRERVRLKVLRYLVLSIGQLPIAGKPSAKERPLGKGKHGEDKVYCLLAETDKVLKKLRKTELLTRMNANAL